MNTSVWRIGQILNSVQSTFVGLLRIWSIPLVLLLSLASGYTTYYGLSHFITDWIALIITVAVQSVLVICSLELAGCHWRANPARFLTVGVTLAVALVVSVSFSYFKFYELSQQDDTLLSRYRALDQNLNDYLNKVNKAKSTLMARQQKRTEAAAKEATQAYLGTLQGIRDESQKRVGKGPIWSHYNELRLAEENRLRQMEASIGELDQRIAAARSAMQRFSAGLKNPALYAELMEQARQVQAKADNLASVHGAALVPAPAWGSHAEFVRGITPSFAMWKDLSLFALACAAMVDFFTLVLSYRLEFSAPGPLTEEEKALAFKGLREFSQFAINGNDELEFVFEKTELERAKRYPDWNRMFTVAFLLNRGFLRKVSERSVEFAPNLYPIMAECMRKEPAQGGAGEGIHDADIRRFIESKAHERRT
jgi:hypothetical protein